MDFKFCLLSAGHPPCLGELHVPRLAARWRFFVQSAHAWIVREYEKIRFSGSSGKRKIWKFSEFSNLNNSANTQWNHFKFGE